MKENNMSNLNRLSAALKKSKIEHIPKEGEYGLTDDSISITKRTCEGHEVSVQIANDETPRGQDDFIVSIYDGRYRELPTVS
tara:strand:- start:158 stop:403 length:246 start_codon:yes stop_codon:yes gene_type:complete